MGLILFDDSLDEEKIRKIATKISRDQVVQQACPAPEEDPHYHSRESCQVTVEERAQLFGYLNN